MIYTAMTMNALLTIRELAVCLAMKPSTLYAWAAQGKIPCVRMHGLIRFHPEEIEGWLSGFAKDRPPLPHDTNHGRDIDEIIAAAKRAIYNQSPARGNRTSIEP